MIHGTTRTRRRMAVAMARRWFMACTLGGMSLIPVAPGHAYAQTQTQAQAKSVADLPLTWVAPKGPTVRAIAVLMTGDGGWAELVRNVADGLSAQGVGVVGFNSRSWLSTSRSPDETATAIVRVIREAQQRWPSKRFVLVGYSRGADFAPFVANRLPADLTAALAGVAMFGLAPSASYEFHWSDLVKDTKRASDIAVMPELLKLRGIRMVCVYGEDEPASGCRDAPADLITKDARDGGHHFDGNVDALVQHILNLLK